MNNSVTYKRRSGERRGQSERFEIRVASRGIEPEIHEVMFGNFAGVEALVETVIQRDVFTRQHLVHTNHLANSYALASGMTGEDRATFLRAAFLHDLGKIAIPDDILLKPSSLTAEEYAAVQKHVEIGETILAPYPAYRRAARIIGQHHEHYDGRGYPRGLKGDEIDPLARAVSVLDAFSAMVLSRPYRRGFTDAAALAELKRCAGTQFDRRFVQIFVDMYEGAVGNHATAALGGAT